MIEIGGYFELELRKGKEYHENSIRLNTGRNAMEYILRNHKYSKIYLPYFICESILEPIKKLGIRYEFYPINENLEPVFNYKLIKNKNVFLYPNYFGLKDQFVKQLSNVCENLIIDNSQAFFSIPLPNVPTFYSCRKFFGVPDGAYLFLNKMENIELNSDTSYMRLSHLLKRIEHGAEDGYADFINNEKILSCQEIKSMSKLTHALLRNIDYEFVMKRRRENFEYYANTLYKINELNLEMMKDSVPLVYPLKTDQQKLKQKLIKNKIFVATYWPNVLNCVNKKSIEYKLTKDIIHLPVDQRYSKSDIDFIIRIIFDEHK